MSLINSETSSKPFYRYHRQFALCEACFWSATILYDVIKEKQNNEITTITRAVNPIEVCPLCNKVSVVLIPLQKNEAYHMSIGDKKGLEIQFSLLKPRR
jgi:hypothetical protein